MDLLQKSQLIRFHKKRIISSLVINRQFTVSFLFFLLLAQKKETKKRAAKTNSPLFWKANAHEESLCFVITSFIELIGRSYCCMLFATHKGAVFFVWIRYSCECFLNRRKRRRWKILSSSKKKITTNNVDVDDKNCLVQLTVIIKLNQLFVFLVSLCYGFCSYEIK